MAITIKVEPQEFTSVYNEVITVLDSTNKSEPKFQYVIDINVEGVFSSRLKVQSNPQGFAVVNLQKHLESYITSSLSIADKEIFKKIEDSYIKYDITLHEEYVLTTSFTSVSDNGGFCQYNYATPHNFVVDDFVTVSNSSVLDYEGVQEVTSVPSNVAIVTTQVFSATATGDSVLSNNTTTIIPDTAVFSATKRALNNVLNWIDVPNWNYGDYILNSTKVGNLLTNVPTLMTTRLDDRFTFNFYNKTSNEAKFLEVDVDNLGLFYFLNQHSLTGDSRKFLSFGAGAFDLLNGTTDVTLPSQTQPVIDGNTKSYTLRLVNETLDPVSDSYTFNVDQRCYPFDGYRLMYLNKSGGFSTFNFELESQKNISVRKTNFKKDYGYYDPSGNTYSWGSSAKGDIRLDTDIKETYSIFSNYVRESVGNLIEDLLVSPEVYHLSDNTYSFDTPSTISNFTGASGEFVTITTTTPHGLNVGDVILLDGINISSYNGEHEVLEIPTTTTVIINKVVVGSLPFPAGTIQKRIFANDGILRAIEIETNSVKIKKRRTDGLINYNLRFRYSNKNTVQR